MPVELEANVQVQAQASVRLFDNKALTSKAATIKSNNLLCGGYPCCKQRSAVASR